MQETEIGGPKGDWESTLWSTVLRAGEGSSSEALERLVSRYWKPVYFYIRRKFKSMEEAKDLTQAFFVYLMEKEVVARASPEKGSFRAYLRTVLERFLSHEHVREEAQKRGGGVKRIPMDFADVETDFSYSPSRPETPEESYERVWMEETLGRVMELFRADCEREDRQVWFEVFRLRFDLKSGGAAYPAIAEKLGIAETDVTNYLHRARGRFRELFIEEVSQGVTGREELEEELRAFSKIL